MKSAFDTSFLTLVLNNKSAASVPNAAELVDDLITELDEKRVKIIVPAPSLTEVLIRVPQSGAKYLEKLKSYSCFQVKAFDEKAAVELAETLVCSIGRKRTKREVSKIKITFDRQIVAVAKAHGASQMYSDDGQVRKFSDECGLESYGFLNLKLKPKQQKLNYDKKTDPEPVPSSAKIQGSGGGPTEGQTGT